MGLIDRWLKRLLDDEVGAPGPSPHPPDDGVTSATGVRAGGEEVGQRSPSSRPGGDVLERLLTQSRERLSLDEKGRRFADSAEFTTVLSTLDGGGRSRASDRLLVDAMLVSPSLKLRRRLAERLLHRGDRDEAKVLLHELKEQEEHAVWSLTKLAEVAELDGDEDGALAWYERVLALDITAEQPRARASRLIAQRQSRDRTERRAQSALTRFLGARAAGARYAVLEEIGRGGAATVFRANDRVLEREVALKIFHPRGKAAERRARLVNEARIAGAFDHPHIVPILDVDAERDLLVMTLCDSGSLRERLRKGRVPLAEAAEIGSILLRTLADIHDAGQLHMDIKPSNLLIHEGRILICDFGTAGLVQMGAAAGTRAYMAPEQRARGQVGPAADLYAAGLLIFECLTGHLPPGVERGQPRMELAELGGGPARRALEGLLTELVEVDPADRPASAREASQRLLEAASLPPSDKEGAQLASYLESLAQREGAEAQARMQRHPLVRALKAPEV